MQVRTRMAPSPTGEYHIGGMRTLLYNYAFAKKNKGKLILRIEDTDQNRLVEGSVDRLLEVIKDYSLSWDEGPKIGGEFGPYVQSERLDLYKKYADELVEKNHAYACFCTSERLSELRKTQQKEGKITKYDRKCLELPKEEVDSRIKNGDPHVIRLRMPDDELISWKDLVVDEVSINTKELDDQVLLKSDGFPTYHLAVVVDDHFMEISHIMRGNEWLPSTPKQIMLYKSLGWEIPLFGHLPNLKEAGSNKKMSKRFGDVHAAAFLKNGYLPEAILNFLMLLGWNPGTEKEIYTLEEFVEDFSMEKVHKTDLVSFDREKLNWFNGQYIRELSTSDLHKRILDWTKKYKVELPKDYKLAEGAKVTSLIQERLKFLSEVPGLISYFYEKPQVVLELLTKFAKTKERTVEILEGFLDLFSKESSWSAENLDKVAHSFISEKGYKPKEAFMTLRVAVSGVTATPPIFDTLEVLGKDEVMGRITASTAILK